MNAATNAPWLLTAFEPFAGRPRNASQVILEHVRAHAGAHVLDRPITTRTLPVVFAELADELDAALALKPRVLVLMGETGAQRHVRVERLAINILDARRRPDNAGSEVTERPVAPGEPLARAATWDVDLVVRTLRAHRIPAIKSYHAGSYACNQALYLALSQAEARGLSARIGFLHVPGRARDLDGQGARIAAALPDVFAVLDEEQPASASLSSSTGDAQEAS